MRTHRGRVRDAIAAAVVDAYPDAVTRPVVSDRPGPTDVPSRHTILVAAAGVDAPSVACPARLYRCSVFVVSAITVPGPGDDDVDDVLDVVLDGLDAAGITWSDVTRGTWQDTHPAYTITTEGTAT